MSHKETDLPANNPIEAEKKDEVASQKKERKPEKTPPELENLLKEIEEKNTIDEKIRHVLGFMRTALSGEKEAQLGLFWKGRTLCMSFFKEAMNQATRSVLWSEYLELVQEARRVKEILDEASSFAVEQIDIAIKAIEENLEHLTELLKESKEISLPAFSDPEYLKHRSLYLSLQKELVLLNSFASRVQTLRKEVIQTGMRLKIKNRFFVRLSACGDHIFPKRREMIKAISDAFQEDVDRFVTTYFQEKTKEAPNYVLREDIKGFQEVAKRLTLNTAAFSKTRKSLSQAWDLLKEQDKERKREFAKKKESFKKNFESMMETVNSFAKRCAEEGVDKGIIEKEAQEILSEMLTLELTREDVQHLKEEIAKAQQPLFAKEKALADEKKRQRVEKEEQRKKSVSSFFSELSALEETSRQMEFEECVKEVARLTQAAQELPLNSSEEKRAHASFQRMESLLSQKQEEAVFSQKGESRFPDELRGLLKKRLDERQQCKKQLEAYRKEIGGSGLNFERAMQLRDLLDEEKKRLELIDQSIEKIEDHIDRHA